MHTSAEGAEEEIEDASQHAGREDLQTSETNEMEVEANEAPGPNTLKRDLEPNYHSRSCVLISKGSDHEEETEPRSTQELSSDAAPGWFQHHQLILLGSIGPGASPSPSPGSDASEGTTTNS